MIVVAPQIDAANPDKLKKLTAYAKRRKLPFFAISGVTGEGLEPLKYAIADAVEQRRAQQPVVVSGPPAKAKKHKSPYAPPLASAKRGV